jgi:hypothetical protein
MGRIFLRIHLSCVLNVAQRDGLRVFDIEVRQIRGAGLVDAKTCSRRGRGGQTLQQRSAV